MIDKLDRLWIANRQDERLSVIQSGQVLAFESFRGVSDRSRMIEASDGRLLLLQRDGLSEIALEQSQGIWKIVERRTYAWDSPKSDFPHFFCDSADGFWFGGADKTIHRFVIPKK